MISKKEKKEQKKKKDKMPHVFTILIALIIVTGLLTYIVPAGSFERVVVDGTTVVDPDSFTFI